MEKKHLRRRCESCSMIYPVYRFGDIEIEYLNHASQYVRWTTDPYSEVMDKDYTLMWLCDGCEYESSMSL